MYNKFMAEAIRQAKIAYSKNEVPVGAVIVCNGEVISSGYNKRESSNNSLAHAEIIAINEACKKLDSWRLSDCDMYVTLEPCPMCTGAIIQSRIQNVYFGAYSKDNGCLSTIVNLPYLLKSTMNIYGGIMEDECSNLLDDFFKKCKTNN